MQEVKLKCDVVPAFDPECGVICKDYLGNGYYFYLNRDLIEEENEEYYCPVKVINELKYFFSVELPMPSIKNKESRIVIRKSQTK